MKRLLLEVRNLWRRKLPFRLAAAYLLLLVVVVLLLPWLPLPYPPNHLDLQHLFLPPFSPSAATAHWLGTDALGRDVLTEMLYGARTGLLMSLPIVLLSGLIGVVFGASAGFYGDHQLTYNRGSLLLCLPLLLFGFYFFALYLPLQLHQVGLDDKAWLPLLVFVLAAAILLLLLRPLIVRLPWFSHRSPFPLDALLVRTIEVVSSVPWLILVLLLASFLPPSVMLLSAILTVTNWTHTARLVRGEMLRVKAMPYMEAAYSLGLSNRQLLFRQALPNLLGPVIIACSFSLAALLTLESTLSFLGVGLPPTVISWGRTISGIRSNTSAWWLVLFPGGFLAFTVLALQTIAYYLLKSWRNEGS